MSVVLYHRVGDPGSVGGKAVPARWDGARLHEGTGAALAALETLRR